MVLLQAGLATAEEEQLPDRFMLRLGGYHARSADTIMRLDANDLPVGAYIDFNQTLGGESSTTVGRMDGLYRFNEHHGLGFAWYSLKFTGSRVLSQDIDWGGVIFPKDFQVNSGINYDIYKLNYQYSLYHNETVELGALFGFHVMRIFADIERVGISQSKSGATTAPLPVFGLFADYKFTPRFSAYYNYQVFSINYEDKVRGWMQDFLLGIEYRMFRNVALGGAYNRFSTGLEAKGDTTTLHIETSWNGGMLYGALYF